MNRRRRVSGGCIDLGREARRSLTDHLDPSSGRRLRHSVGGEPGFVGRVNEQQIAHLDDVEQPVALTPSQVDGIGKDAVGNPGPQSTLGDHVDIALQQLLQVHEEAAEVEQAPPRLEIDEEVDVARVGCFTAGDRADDAHVRGPPSARDLDDLVATLAQLRQRRCGHVNRVGGGATSP